jgi:hypothetical protein
MAALLNMTNGTRIAFHETNLCAQVDELRNEYVFYSGGIAGINDAPQSERDPETFDRSADVVELDRN